MTATVARLAESDWRVFAVIRLRALSEALGESDPQYQKEVSFTAAQWRRRLRDHAQFAALVGDRPVGLIAAQRENPDNVYLYSLWLDPSASGTGVGPPAGCRGGGLGARATGADHQRYGWRPTTWRRVPCIRAWGSATL